MFRIFRRKRGEPVTERQPGGYVRYALGEIVPVDAQIRTLLRQIDGLAGYTRGKHVDQLANIELFFYTYDCAYRPYAWNRAALERLKASGALQAMHDPELVSKIAAYDALTHHLDQDFLDDTDVQLMVNAMLGIRTAISPRVEGELPRLRKMADEITALIEKEYP
jgi:hypothetical protein